MNTIEITVAVLLLAICPLTLITVCQIENKIDNLEQKLIDLLDKKK